MLDSQQIILMSPRGSEYFLKKIIERAARTHIDLRQWSLDCGDNAPKLAGDGFGDRFERRISNMLHGYCRIDGG
jgi:hypothetical protein